MLSKVFTGAVIGVDGRLMEVEVDIANGLPAFATVGLPEASVRESKERVKSAIVNCGYSFPAERVTVNLAPAHIKKEGTGFDLPIAVGILAATEMVPPDQIRDFVMLGELALDGRVKPVNGSLPMATAARDAGFSGILVPHENRREAAVVEDLAVYAVNSLVDAVAFLRNERTIEPEISDAAGAFCRQSEPSADFSEVAGQAHVKRALEIAAAGSHNVLMIGPPGAGKTMLARRFAGIIPPLSFDEAIETTKVYSVSGLLGENEALVRRRPFRAPHHTISDAGLIGGGNAPRPGEVSLAHHGVLFLDELPEFKKSVLEVMRQPLEDREVTISRASTSVTFPADFVLVTALNPCPCGYYTDPSHECRCSAIQIKRYRDRLSGPLLDRIDLHVEVPAVGYQDLAHAPKAESSAEIRERVCTARQVQTDRLKNTNINCNAGMKSRHIRQFCKIDEAASAILENALEKLGLSARAYHRILKIARTIADLDGSADIAADHVREAIQYRSLDRGGGSLK